MDIITKEFGYVCKRLTYMYVFFGKSAPLTLPRYDTFNNQFFNVFGIILYYIKWGPNNRFRLQVHGFMTVAVTTHSN